MLTTAAFAEIAALVGDPARANMLMALMDGRALTATELAGAAGVTPQTASGHLARLSEAGLLAVEQHGRHKYHRVASPAVAQMLESIMSVAIRCDEGGKIFRKAALVGPRDKALRHARACYDHLAGRLAVAIAGQMTERGHLDLTPDGGALSAAGTCFLRDLGVDLEAATMRAAGRRGNRVFCRPCLDWSERRPHIAGALGAALFQSFLAKGWLRRVDGTRAVTVTPAGQAALGRAFELGVETLVPD